MKANELRIGNYVKSDEIELTKVTASLLHHMISLKGLLSGFVEPISLTEEWLVKFGFEKRKDSNILWDKSDLFSLFTIADKIKYKAQNHTLHVMYVHQLQNLYYALTGQELKYVDK